MALTILFKFCGFIVHSKPNNMTLSAFPRKIPETRKIVFKFSKSAKIAPKPTDQYCSNSISGVHLQIFRVSFFFDLPSKWSVVHIREKLKMFVLWKTPSTILIKFCGFIVHSSLNSMTLSAIHGKSFKLKKKNIYRLYILIFYPSPSLATKPTVINLVQIHY